MSDEMIENIRIVSARLLKALGILIGVLLVIFVAWYLSIRKENGEILSIPVLPIVLVFGAIGSFISLQRRLKQLSEQDLRLFQKSLPYTWLAPVAGAILAGILYVLFISGLISGGLFPQFQQVGGAFSETGASGLTKLLYVMSYEHTDYAKLIFWSFVSGFSERFVTDIIGRFQANAGNTIG